jgi:hypothetical protein
MNVPLISRTTNMMLGYRTFTGKDWGPACRVSTTIDVHTFPFLASGSSFDAVCFLILISDFMSLSWISLTKVKMIYYSLRRAVGHGGT